MTQDELKLVLEALKGDMTERKTLEMALGTLEAIATSEQARDLVNSTIAAIRRVLTQPEQEPVAWLNRDSVDGLWHVSAFKTDNLEPSIPLYKHPAPQRKPLTHLEIWNTYKNLWMFHPAEEPRLAGDVLKFARAIEAAHGIKENT